MTDDDGYAGLNSREEQQEGDPLYLEKKYPHPRDATIQFFEGPHIYKVDWDFNGDYQQGNIKSVTGFVHDNFPHFDADKVIVKMRASKNWPKSKYYGMLPEEIKEMWAGIGKEASSLGTVMHEQIELMYNGIEPKKPLSVEYKQFEAYQKKMEDLGYIPFRTEWRLRSDRDHEVTGTIDMLYIQKEPTKTLQNL